MMFMKKMSLYLQLIRFEKPIGSLLLLWPTLCSLWLVYEGMPPVGVLMAFTMGAFFSRSLGCIINDYCDRDIDLHVDRTKTRVLTSKKLNNKDVAFVAMICLIGDFACLFVLPYTVWAYAVLGLGALSLYPLMKRWIRMPQLFLGFTYSIGILMASGMVFSFPPPHILILFLANSICVFAYDTVYALMDREDDLKIGIYSSAVFLGSWDLIVVSILYAIVLLLWVLLGLTIGASWQFYGLLMAASILVASFIRATYSRKRENYMKVFLGNSWLGILFLLMCILR